MCFALRSSRKSDSPTIRPIFGARRGISATTSLGFTALETTQSKVAAKRPRPAARSPKHWSTFWLLLSGKQLCVDAIPLSSPCSRALESRAGHRENPRHCQCPQRNHVPCRDARQRKGIRNSGESPFRGPGSTDRQVHFLVPAIQQGVVFVEGATCCQKASTREPALARGVSANQAGTGIPQARRQAQVNIQHSDRRRRYAGNAACLA